VVKLYEIVNADFKEHSDSCATDFPLITHAARGAGGEPGRGRRGVNEVPKDIHRDIEDMRIKGGKSEREWSMVTPKGSGKVFGPK
jgi:hypothetical protein